MEGTPVEHPQRIFEIESTGLKHPLPLRLIPHDVM